MPYDPRVIIDHGCTLLFLPMKLTTAQTRVMRVIAASGHAPGNTTMRLLCRLRDAGLIKPGNLRPIVKMGNWTLTAQGQKALKAAECDEACRSLSAACARILG
jgi:hypothetical protein